VHELANLPFRPFDFHGYLATRQVVSFGDRCDYDRRAVVEASPFPSFLVLLRNKIAAIFYRSAEIFRQVLINEYRPGAGIGWHHDEAQFDAVVVVSLLARAFCVFARRPARLGTERRSRSSHARFIFFRGPPAPRGSTAFPRSIIFVIQSPCGRSLQRLLLERRARNGSVLLGLRSFRLHREKATGSATELRARDCRS
jgi:hypothetical protein